MSLPSMKRNGSIRRFSVESTNDLAALLAAEETQPDLATLEAIEQTQPDLAAPVAAEQAQFGSAVVALDFNKQKQAIASSLEDHKILCSRRRIADVASDFYQKAQDMSSVRDDLKSRLHRRYDEEEKVDEDGVNGYSEDNNSVSIVARDQILQPKEIQTSAIAISGSQGSSDTWVSLPSIWDSQEFPNVEESDDWQNPELVNDLVGIYENSELVVADLVDDKHIVKASTVSEKYLRRKRRRVIYGLILGVILIVIAIIFSIVFGKGDAPTPPLSPQAKALMWLENNLNETFSEERKKQRFAMATLFYSTGGEEWASQENLENKWLSSDHECEWFTSSQNRSSVCDRYNSSTGNFSSSSSLLHLQLNINRLLGTLPPELNLLTKLEMLDLSDNGMRGSIPSEVGTMSDLTRLILQDNGFSNSIPSELGLLTNLKVLDISFNDIEGYITSELFNMRNLQRMDFSENHITGKIPTDISSLSQLTSLSVKRNLLEGTIPSELSMLKDLELLTLSENNFDGPLPFFTNSTNQTSGFGKLKRLSLSSNFLTGSIQSYIGLLSSIQDLDMNNNLINGPIPSEIGLVTSLLSLELENNNLNGALPTEIGLLRNVEIVDLHSNKLSGSLPSELGRLSALDALDLSYNNFTNQVPSELGSWKEIDHLDFSNNSFKGQLPSELGMWTELKSLNLRHNSFTGSLPSEFKMWTTLESLDLGYNKFSGSLPSEFGMWKKLDYLDLCGNRFDCLLPSKSDLWVNASKCFHSGKCPPISSPTMSPVLTSSGGTTAIPVSSVPTYAPTSSITTCSKGLLTFTVEFTTKKKSGNATWRLLDGETGNSFLQGGPYNEKEVSFVNATCVAIDSCIILEISDLSNGSPTTEITLEYNLYLDGTRVGTGGFLGSPLNIHSGNCPLFSVAMPPPVTTTPSTAPLTSSTTVPSTTIATKPIAGATNSFCDSGFSAFRFELTTDQNPSQISWDLREGTNRGKKIAESTAYRTAGKTYIHDVCISSDSCATFTIRDEEGNGICCRFGDGRYRLTLDGEEVASGGNFGRLEKKKIGTCATAETNKVVTAAPSIAPKLSINKDVTISPPIVPKIPLKRSSTLSCADGLLPFKVAFTTESNTCNTTWELMDETSGTTLLAGGPYTDEGSTFESQVCIIVGSCTALKISGLNEQNMTSGILVAYYNLYLGGARVGIGGYFGPPVNIQTGDCSTLQ